MAVINLTPHSLKRLVVHTGYEDENGDWHKGYEMWGDPVSCHAVAAGKANEIAFPDGTTAIYSYTVGRLSPDCPEFSIGERVLLDIFGIEKEYQVKGFHRYQLQSKIWV